MPIPLRLRIDPTTEGWRIALGDRDGRPVVAWLGSDAVEALREGIAEQMHADRMPVLLVPGDDAAWTAREERIGQRLAVVFQAPDVATRLSRLRGVAEGRGAVLVLVLDTEDASIGELPWELLAARADEPPLQASAQAVVARLATGRAVEPLATRSRLRSVVWAPQPDATARRLIDALHTITRRHEVPAPTPVSEAPIDPEDAVVLHLVCHGRRVGETVALLTDLGHALGTAVHVLSRTLRRAALVVLDICEAGHATRAAIDSLVDRVIGAGARACVATAGALGLEASSAFADGVYGALSKGASLVAAVSEGRRAVRELALPYPDARWARLRWTIAGLDVLMDGPLVARAWRPDGWPLPAPDASRLLIAARAQAERAGAGYVGVEHLALAFADQPPTVDTPRIRFQIVSRMRRLEDFLGRFEPSASGETGTDWAGTPRLRRCGASLTSGFTTAELWRVLSVEASATLRVLTGGVLRVAAGDGTADERTAPDRTAPDGHTVPGIAPAQPSNVIELIGGPEDGRCVELRPGDTLGRASAKGTADHRLYGATALRDPALSRLHLRWLGAGAVELLARAHHAGAGEAPRGTRLTLRPGALIGLTRATWLRLIP